jgi:hypothetical protein
LGDKRVYKLGLYRLEWVQSTDFEVLYLPEWYRVGWATLWVTKGLA